MMDEPFLYNRIAESIRQNILDGILQPNDRLPAIRELTLKWNCTPGTVQRAYKELAQQGLIISQAGKGTHVSGKFDQTQFLGRGPLRKATLVHKAEAFLLEMLTAGFDLPEVQQAFNLALDHWRGLQNQTESQMGDTLRFYGSHDSAVAWLSNHIQEIAPNSSMLLVFTGSLGGLIALAEGRADLAGTHLWDAETNTYNIPYIRKLFPGKKVTITRLAERRTGLIVAAGNPLNIQGLDDLARPQIRFINRQAGSGTRVWLDANLERMEISPERINGYEDERTTHSEVARTIAEGKADAGLGLESAARAFNLDFVFLVQECYDLAAFTQTASREPLSTLLSWLKTESARLAIGQLQGYQSENTGLQFEI
jgi:molybdate-binding protein/DNA-binding transcriptional regulator YhcF (GntR family)